MTTTRLVLIASVLLILCLVALWLPRLIVGRRAKALDVKERLTIENEMRAVSLQAITALVLIVGAGVAIMQLNDTQGATRAQISLTRDAQEGAQFTQAVSQLAMQGSQNLPARLGGVYALTRLALASPSYQQSVFEVVTTYVRQAAPRISSKVPAPVGPLSGRDPALQAALVAIGGPLADKSANRIIGLSIDVPDADSVYLGDADFSSGYFVRADFKLDGLDDSNFRKSDLRGACFLGSSVDGTDFRGADLRGANFLDVENLDKAYFDINTLYDQNTKWPEVSKKILRSLHKISDTQNEIAPAPCNR